jgi:hypothetical protein
MTTAYLKMGRNIAGCYPTVNITKPLQTPEKVEKLVNKAADCQINAMRGRHEQNKNQTEKRSLDALLICGLLILMYTMPEPQGKCNKSGLVHLMFLQHNHTTTSCAN